MNLSAPDYIKIYKVQDSVLPLIAPLIGDFYLTGGTALARFYLNHRYSDDLDFFTHRNTEFQKKVREIFELLKLHYTIEENTTVLSTDFIRINISKETTLKMEFVNDIAYRWGNTILTQHIAVDNIANILANKLTALVSRDEPKDVFDIVSIAEHYAFNWKEIFKHAFEKQIMNETDVSDRLAAFPVEWLQNKLWLKSPIDADDLKQKLEIIADDFLFARDNSFGKGKIPITEAKPNVY